MIVAPRLIPDFSLFARGAPKRKYKFDSTWLHLKPVPLKLLHVPQSDVAGLESHPSLVSQGSDRVHSRRTAGGYESSYYRDQCHTQQCCGEREHISQPEPKKH